MIHYTWFNCYSRAVLANLDAVDPFDLAPGEIVERPVAAGYTPCIEAPQPDLLPMPGAVTECEGLTYVVAISRETQEIDVQGRRAEAYETIQ